MEAIKILGAGIAGLTAAINLAKKSSDVTIYEKASLVGNRFSGDFQGLENWSDEKDVLNILKDISIKTDFWHKGFKELSIYTDLKREFVLRDKNNLFYLIKRGPKNSLDESLKNQAVDFGVKIKFNSTTKEKDCNIIATGPLEKKPSGIVKGLAFDTNASDSATLIFNNDMAYKGYSYLFIVEEKATIGAVILNDFSKANSCFKKTINSFKKIKDLEIRNPKAFSGCGYFSLNQPRELNGKPFIGEAAGFQDYLSGFGMKYAFLSGYLASESIIKNEDYCLLWKNQLLDKLKASVVNRFFYELFGTIGYNYIANQAANSKKPREWLKDFYSFSSSKKMIYPAAKLAKL